MHIPRVIPCLLLKGKGLVKTVKFKDPKYVGDPINAVHIFNEKEVDELVFLDITATIEGRGPRMDVIAAIAGECFMPMSYGGGISTIEQVKDILSLGIEKVILNSSVIVNPYLIHDASDRFGSQSIVASIDVRRKMFGGYEVFTHGGRKSAGLSVIQYAQKIEAMGAGEILLTSIDRDGTMKGYDIELIRQVSETVSIPIVACGGAGKIEDLRDAVHKGSASATAAGSMFVFNGPHRAVLISYPGYQRIANIMNS